MTSLLVAVIVLGLFAIVLGVAAIRLHNSREAMRSESILNASLCQRSLGNISSLTTENWKLKKENLSLSQELSDIALTGPKVILKTIHFDPINVSVNEGFAWILQDPRDLALSRELAKERAWKGLYRYVVPFLDVEEKVEWVDVHTRDERRSIRVSLIVGRKRA